MIRIIGVVIGLAVLVVLPNSIWLFRSTAVVTNATDNVITGVTATVDDSVVVLGTLDAGESKFVFLPDSGDATLVVSCKSNGMSRTACHEYVEGTMYDVDIFITDPEAVCRTYLPILDDLFVRHLL